MLNCITVLYNIYYYNDIQYCYNVLKHFVLTFNLEHILSHSKEFLKYTDLNSNDDFFPTPPHPHVDKCPKCKLIFLI